MTVPSPLRACFVGDSLTLGVGDPEALGWVGWLAAGARRNGHDLTAYNLGIRRDTSRDIAERWESETSARLPSGQRRLIVFSFGTKDCLDDPDERRLTQEQSLGHARAILSAARERGAVLMVGPPPTADDEENSRVAALSGGLAGLCDELGVDYLPLFPALVENADWSREVRAGDGYHPGPAGDREVARLLEHWPAWQRALEGQSLGSSQSSA